MDLIVRNMTNNRCISVGKATFAKSPLLNTPSEPHYAPFPHFYYVPQKPPVYMTGKHADYSKSPIQSELYTEYAHGTGKVSLIKPDKIPKTIRKKKTGNGKGKFIKVNDSQLHLYDPSESTTELTLVSHGKPNHNCGELRAKMYCEQTNSFIRDLPHRCHRAVCPICWDSWVEREVQAATEKFLSGLDLLRDKNVKNQAHHIVWSVPPEDYYLTRQQLKTRLLYRMRWAGAIASAIIFHPFRFRSLETGSEVQWKHCSLNRNAESPIVQSEAYYSPHYHTACVGYLKPSKDFYKQFRWRYYKQNKVQLNNADRVRRMLWYSLSHCAVADQKHALSWAQKFGNRHMLIDTKTEERKYPTCPIKKCPWGNVSLIIIEYQKALAEYVQDGQRELYWIMQTKTTYKFREPDKSKTPS